MNQLVVTLIVILFPGILATVICDKITVHSTWTAFKFGMYAVVLGVFSYGALQLLTYTFDAIAAWSIRDADWSHLSVWKSTVDDDPGIPATEVFLASLVAIPIAFLASSIINYKLINKLAHKIGVSTKYGDENLFSYYLNAKEIDWIYVRDIPNDLTYQGQIVSYSENEHIQEIVMSNVTVYRYADSEELYSLPTIYLAREIGMFVIEAIPDDFLGEPNEKETTD